MEERIKKGSKTQGTKDAKDISIPVSIFRDREVTVFERLVEYLKDEKELRYCEIATLLNRDHRTVYTIFNRVQTKRKYRK